MSALNHRNKSSTGICYKSCTYWHLKTFHYAVFQHHYSTSIAVIEREPISLSYFVLSSLISWFFPWIFPFLCHLKLYNPFYSVSFLSVTESRELSFRFVQHVLFEPSVCFQLSILSQWTIPELGLQLFPIFSVYGHS